MTSPGGSGPGPPWVKTSIKKKEKWLVTRKTWRYMADAGKLLIPESLRKGKDIKGYTDDDIAKLDEHFQEVCDQQQEFIEWEGPRQDPRLLLASNRGPQTSSNGALHTNFILHHSKSKKIETKVLSLAKVPSKLKPLNFESTLSFFL